MAHSTSSPAPTPTFDAAATSKYRLAVFPVKVYLMLKDVTNNRPELESVISWSPDGKSFTIHDKERFSKEILPVYFGSLKYRSFQKNLNMWNIRQERSGECSHPLFLRDSEALVYEMKRQAVANKKKAAEAVATYLQRDSSLDQHFQDEELSKSTMKESTLSRSNFKTTNSSLPEVSRLSPLQEALYRQVLTDEINRLQRRQLLQDRANLALLRSLTSKNVDTLADLRTLAERRTSLSSLPSSFSAINPFL